MLVLAFSLRVCRRPWRSEEGVRCPGAGVTGGCEPPDMVVQGLNLSLHPRAFSPDNSIDFKASKLNSRDRNFEISEFQGNDLTITRE